MFKNSFNIRVIAFNANTYCLFDATVEKSLKKSHKIDV